MVGASERTRVPGLPRRADSAVIARTAAVSEPCRARPATSWGDALASSSVRGSAECTPPTIGATSRSATRAPQRARITASTLAPGREPMRAGSPARGVTTAGDPAASGAEPSSPSSPSSVPTCPPATEYASAPVLSGTPAT